MSSCWEHMQAILVHYTSKVVWHHMVTLVITAKLTLSHKWSLQGSKRPKTNDVFKWCSSICNQSAKCKKPENRDFCDMFSLDMWMWHSNINLYITPDATLTSVLYLPSVSRAQSQCLLLQHDLQQSFYDGGVICLRGTIRNLSLLVN